MSELSYSSTGTTLIPKDTTYYVVGPVLTQSFFSVENRPFCTEAQIDRCYTVEKELSAIITPTSPTRLDERSSRAKHALLKTTHEAQSFKKSQKTSDCHTAILSYINRLQKEPKKTPWLRGYENDSADGKSISYTVGFVSRKRPLSTEAQIGLSYTVEKGRFRLNFSRLSFPTDGSSRKT